MTAQELYERMLETYAQRTGMEPDPGCDLAVRLYAAAAQLETLYQYADWSRRQAFPQTADGIYLDYHGQMRNLTRAEASCAGGRVLIQLHEAQTEELVFPAQMSLISDNNVRFALLREYRLAAGLTSVSADVTALDPGPQGNLAAGTRLCFSAGPACVESVTASAAFRGGADPEDDEAFRARLLESYRPGANGANMAYYCERALTVDGIAACRALPAGDGPLSVVLVVAAQNGMPTAQQLNNVSALFASRMELGMTLRINAPQQVLLQAEITIRCTDGVSFAEAEAAVRQTVTDYFTGKLLGKPVYESALSHTIFGTGLVTDCVVDLGGQGETVPWNGLPMLESLQIEEADG